MKIEIANHLKWTRRSAGLTQAQLAKEMKTKQASIARAENGNVSSLTFIQKYIKACGYEFVIYHLGSVNENDKLTSYIGESSRPKQL